MANLLRVLCLATLLCVPSLAAAQLRAEKIWSGFGTPLVAYVQDPVATGSFGIRDIFYQVYQDGLVAVAQTPNAFIDLRGVVGTGPERGLLGMAFPPDAATSGYVFFSFTDLNGDLVVARFNRTFGDRFSTPRAVPGTRLDLKWSTGERVIRQPSANNNGGHLAFGPDGYLYVGVGDGGGVNDPQNNAQNPNTLLGKMLRINVRIPAGDPNGFQVPADNPFLEGVPIAALPEIWSFGWRNPWRYSFDDFGDGATGALIAGDVGEGAREEINYEPKGAEGRNYGWRMREGTVATPGVPPTDPAFLPLTDPIHDYPHPDGFAVTGGFVYRGGCLPAKFRGRYFFADYLASRVWSLGLSVDPVTGEAKATDLLEHTAELGGPGQLGRITSFTRDPKGELYMTSFAGDVWKISPSPQISNAPCELRAIVSVNNVRLEWDPPADGGGTTRYLLEGGTSPGARNLGGAFVTGTSAFISDVPNGTYYARVRSVGLAGVSQPTRDVEVLVRGRCVAPPPAPRDVRVHILFGTVTLTWSLDGTPDGPASIILEAGSVSGASDIAVLTLDPNTRGLTAYVPGRTYYVRIRTRNACGTNVTTELVLLV